MPPVLFLAQVPLHSCKAGHLAEVGGAGVLAGGSAGHLQGGGDPDPGVPLCLLTLEQEWVIQLSWITAELLTLLRIENILLIIFL